jgi:hypothetical protein
MPLGAGFFMARAVAVLLILGLLAFDVLTYAYRRDLAHSGCQLPDLLEIVTPALLPPPSWRDIGPLCAAQGQPRDTFPNARRWLVPRPPPVGNRGAGLGAARALATLAVLGQRGAASGESSRSGGAQPRGQRSRWSWRWPLGRRLPGQSEWGWWPLAYGRRLMIMAKPPARRQGAARSPTSLTGCIRREVPSGRSDRGSRSGSRITRARRLRCPGPRCPGLDPGKDVEVTVGGGVLPIHAGHPEKHEEARRSEFRYGSLPDSVALPGGANPDKITVSYDSGILEVKVPVKEPRVQSPRIAIEQPE